jgi:hypothetical protein
MSLNADSEFILICSALILQVVLLLHMNIMHLNDIHNVYSSTPSDGPCVSTNAPQQRHERDRTEHASFDALLASRESHQSLFAFRSHRHDQPTTDR